MMPVKNTELKMVVFKDLGPERERCEQEAAAAGTPLPVPHRIGWARTRHPAKSWLFTFRDALGRWAGGFGAEVSPSRVLPGYVLLRCQRFGAGLGHIARDAAEALHDFAYCNPRILRVNVEIFSRDPSLQDELNQALRGAGFQPATVGERYERTVVLDLRQTDKELLTSLRPNTRRNIRAVAKHPVAIRPVSDPVFVTRVQELTRETLARTGGTPSPRDWPAIFEFSRKFPADSRIAGLFRTDQAGPDSLLAFSWGCRHGEYGHQESAASTRATTLKMPLGYPLTWDLICWSRQHGARWFDFGGITYGTHGNGDRLGGISDFKRAFSTQIVSVGSEWVLEPRWLQARVARLVSAGVSWFAERKAAFAQR